MAARDTQEESAAREEVCERIYKARADGETIFHCTQNFALRRFPDQIRNLKTTLQVLHIDNNYELIALPPAIGELSNLRWLNVSYNRLQELPAEIGRLSRLERLHVNNNRLQRIPLEIWSLKALEELHCDSNQIQALPTGILGMRRLREVTLDNNPLVTDVECDGADLYDKFPKLPYGDCASCRVRFLTYVVACTFHRLPGCADPVPVVHYCSSENCLSQLMTRLASLDASPVESPTKAIRAPPVGSVEADSRDAELQAL